MFIIVIGVSGSGKSTLGMALGEALAWQFLEADDFHSQENIDKMSGGEALTDADRWPWLAAIRRRLQALDQQEINAVLACSALKKSYRDMLGEGMHDIHYVFLCGDPGLIRQRLRTRENHFMPASLLDSQIAAMEPPDDAVLVPVDQVTAAQVADVLRQLRLEPAA